jgi:hypothetical protein
MSDAAKSPIEPPLGGRRLYGIADAQGTSAAKYPAGSDAPNQRYRFHRPRRRWSGSFFQVLECRLKRPCGDHIEARGIDSGVIRTAANTRQECLEIYATERPVFQIILGMTLLIGEQVTDGGTPRKSEDRPQCTGVPMLKRSKNYSRILRSSRAPRRT